ncbi:MAG: hypothetical protein HY814_15435 [Candidatus Riflebacteria bacterium]|nr:hypothetical protein [Candidatus Riflebacteria bacterium]
MKILLPLSTTISVVAAALLGLWGLVPQAAAASKRPVLAIVSLAAGAAGVAPGGGFAASVKLRNRSESPVKLGRVRLVFEGDGFKAEDRVMRETLAPGAEKLVKLVVEATSSTGTSQIVSAVCYADDSEEAKPLSVANLARPVEVVVQGLPKLEVVSMQAAKLVVSARETFLTTVVLRVKGDGAAEIDTVRLDFQNRLLSAEQVTAPKRLEGPEGTVSYTFRVQAGEFPGACRIRGVNLVAVDAVTKNPLQVTWNVAPEALVVTVVRER